MPGQPVSLLADSLAEGAESFYRRKGRYDPATWDGNVFLHFYQGVFHRAAAVFACRVRTAAGVDWDVAQQPFLDWRQENPGGLEVNWQPEALPGAHGGDLPGRLCRLVLSGCHYRPWAVERLLGLLESGDGADVR